MAETLLKKFETRINNERFKAGFLTLLKEKGHFLKFDELNRGHQYAVNLNAAQVHSIVEEPVLLNGFYTFYVALKNGSLQVLKAA